MTMERKEKFECPHCKKKLPFFFVVIIKSGHAFECQNCGKTIIPESTKSFTWGYVFGFLGFIIPAKILLYFYNDFLFAFLAGLMSGLTVVFFIALFIYSNTILTKTT